MNGRIVYVGGRVEGVDVTVDGRVLTVARPPAGVALSLVTDEFSLPIDKALQPGDSLTFDLDAVVAL